MAGFPNALAFEALTPTEIAKAATIFDNLKHLRIKLKNGDENILEKAFEIHVQSLLEKLEGRLNNLQDNPQFQKMEIILAKHGLYDAAFQQVILLCQSSKSSFGVLFIVFNNISLSLSDSWRWYQRVEECALHLPVRLPTSLPQLRRRKPQTSARTSDPTRHDPRTAG
jgi:hypothetical protein